MALSFNITAQNKFTISGYVTEKGSRETLPGVAIYSAKHNAGTTSNNYGFYSITLPADSIELTFSFVGFQPRTEKIVLKENIKLNIDISNNIELTEVEISAAQQRRISEETQMSMIEIPVQQVKDIPALLGEKDVLKVIQLMPGVQKGSEGSSGLYVRGGGPDQNLIILDDATVYNAYHLFGFFSLFNGDALKSIELTKGGFPARYGGRLSSVLEMQMKDGDKEKIHGEAGIGIISSRFTLEGPIFKKKLKNKASFLVSARRTYIDALVYPFLPKDGKAGYYFYDMNAKLNYTLSDKDRFFVSGYFGKDKFYARFEDYDFSDEIFLKWGNATSTVRWNHLFNDKLFSNASLIFCNYKLGIGYKEEYKDDNSFFKLDYSSGIRDYGFKYDFDFLPNANHFIKFGVMSTYHRFTPNAVVVKSSFEFENEKAIQAIYALESGLYIEDDYKVTKKLKVNGGVRLSHFNVKGTNYLNPEPRIAMRYMLKKDLSFKASYAMMNQYLHLLTGTGISLPTDLWVPTTKKVKPQQSQQVAMGFAKDWQEKNLTFSLEGYYKKSERILGYKEGASFLLIDDLGTTEEVKWENMVTAGQGWSYGAEFLIQKKVGKFSGWIGYTLSWTQLQFDSLNFGKKYYARYDRRHDFSIVAIYKINDHITLSGTWVYGTGNAITLPVAEYEAIPHNPIENNTPGFNEYNYFISDYGDKNSFRMAAYHRMDIGIQFHKKLKRCERTFELSFYNLYNRQNPFFYFVGTSDSNYNQRVLKQISLFPIIPSVSWTYKF